MTLRLGRRAPRPPCAWSCSGRTHRRAAARRARARPPLRLQRAAGKFGEDRWPRPRPRGTLPIAAPPSLTKSCGLSLPALPTPSTISRADRQPGRRDDVERAAALAGEPVGRRRAPHQVPGRRQAPCGSRGPNFTPSSQNTMRTPLAGVANGRMRALRHRPWQFLSEAARLRVMARSARSAKPIRYGRAHHRRRHAQNRRQTGIGRRLRH